MCRVVSFGITLGLLIGVLENVEIRIGFIFVGVWLVCRRYLFTVKWRAILSLSSK